MGTYIFNFRNPGNNSTSRLNFSGLFDMFGRYAKGIFLDGPLEYNVDRESSTNLWIAGKQKSTSLVY